MINRDSQNRKTLQEIDQIWDQLVTLSESRKYYFRFHGVQYRQDPKKAWKHKMEAIKRLDALLMDLRNYQLKKVLMEVVKMEPEIMLICWDAPKKQQEKITELLGICRNKLAKILLMTKHPNPLYLKDRRTVNMLPAHRNVIMLDKVMSR